MSTPYSPSSRGSSIISPGNTGAGSLAQSDISRMLPRQISSGSTRGTQTVGYGNTKIDGTNNTITIGNQSTGFSISLGVIQNSTSGEGVGFSITDSTGFNVFKMDGNTWYWYDAASKKNVMQIGFVAQDFYGFAVASPGYDVADGFS